MVARQFEKGQKVTFKTGETVEVAKVTGYGIPFQTVLVWLDFPGVDHSVPYRIAELRRRIV